VLVARVSEEIARGEHVLAVMPFASIPKFPGRVKRRDKVRVGLRQSWQRYRPTAFTDRAVYVFESGRTPHPRQLLARFALGDVRVVDVLDGSFGGRVLLLELPGAGEVPFELGRKDLDDLATALQLLGIRS
jgi:hypothetical protein